jgi:hypothetical protein
LVHIRDRDFYEATEQRVEAFSLWVATKELPSQRTNIRLFLEESTLSSAFFDCQEETDIFYTHNHQQQIQAVVRKIV